MSRTVLLAVSIIVIIALFERLSLVIVNREANDDHFRVIQLLLVEPNSLTMADCRECFHPKLYYITCAAVLAGFRISDPDTQIVVAQVCSALSGFFTLLCLWVYLRHEDKLTALLVFMLIAINPRLIAISSQVSNDSFAILFSSLAILLTQRYLVSDKLSVFCWALLAVVLAVLSKGTSWPAVASIFLVLATRSLISTEDRLRNVVVAGLVPVAFALSVVFGGYDLKNYDRYANLGKGHPIHWQERTIVGRPGVISIVDSYLTFPLIDMLKHPIISRDAELVPWHRCNLWSQLYGRFNCIQFDYHPPSWRTRSKSIATINRLIMVGALPLLVAFFVGALAFCVKLKTGFDSKQHLLPLTCVAFYLAFIIYFSLSYRDFASMKAIYILPGILPYAACLQGGFQITMRIIDNKKRLERWFFVGVISLACAYALNVELLIRHLQRTL